MTVMEFRTGGPVRGPRGPGVLAGLRRRLTRRRRPVAVPQPRTAQDATTSVPPRAGRPG